MTNDWLKALTFIVGLAMSLSISAHSQQSVASYAQLDTLARDLSLQFMDATQQLAALPDVERDQRAKQLVNAQLVPHLDLEFSSLKLLGKHVRGLDRQQTAEFTKLIESQLVNMYAQVLIDYKGADVALKTLQTNQGRKFAEAAVEIEKANSERSQLIFKFKQDPQGQWRVYDVVSRQVSQLSVKRQSLVLKISKIGFEQLNHELRQSQRNEI
ncbi:ABC transporter substrate-binding protein [Pseudoalteromonas obscura]|uniref:ABC transporter substrate-binding protein n=1 Tax=Pseudoalteromonas obscura TaxID=3048491 RepID=A0ABT7EP74_9GAMM|nr:ABC transporter substrate-binding protein [Pseudoalteromonas sp. P94(2023)]MDK2596857.1 ABC transporter substrate-binding protein [Pseudoalteromonas sp. P94(2023)]